MQLDTFVHIRHLRRQQTIVKRFKDWERWKLMFPFVAILIIYPISKFIVTGDEVINAFGHGDLLLFSALVLIELSIETTHINRELDRSGSDKIDSLIENSRLFGVLFILIYGSMKLLVGHGAHTQIPRPKAWAFCAFSVSVTFLVVSFGVFAFWKTLRSVVCEDT
jgi:hypothetical protein